MKPPAFVYRELPCERRVGKKLQSHAKGHPWMRLRTILWAHSNQGSSHCIASNPE